MQGLQQSNLLRYRQGWGRQDSNRDRWARREANLQKIVHAHGLKDVFVAHPPVKKEIH